jgi:predicted nucleic acid-binding protein
MDRVYLDNCCNSRLFDDDTQPKVKAQAAKIRHIINNRIKGGYIIIGSFAGETEIGQIPDDGKRREAEQSYKESIDETVKLSAQIIARAQKLESMGLGAMDARHLAAAEAAGAGFLLTTDEKFIRKCQNRNLTAVKVINPTEF